MKLALVKSFFSLILIGSIAAAALAESRGGLRSIASITSIAEPTDREAIVISTIDRQADAVFKEFSKTNPRVPLTLLRQAQRSAVYRLKQMHVITDVLKASGPSTATTIVATEVLTNFILAPIAGAMGKPALAGALVAVPWGLFTGLGAFSLETWKLRYKMARSLGVRSLKPFDRIRDIVIGYDLRYRVSSIIYQSVSQDLGEVQFEVLRKGMDFSRARVPAVTVDDLENIVRAADAGESYLQAIYIERLDATFYSALLLRFIDSDSGSTGRLIELLKSRQPSPENAVLAKAELRQHLMATADVRAKIDREIKTALEMRKATKKRVKKGELHKDDAIMIRDYLDEEFDRLLKLRAALSKHEYGVLQDAQEQTTAGVDLANVEVATARSTALVKLASRARLDLEPIALPVLVKSPMVCSDLFAVGF